MRVLIVEDDVAVGELLQGFVRDLGHESELVPSAEAALQRLQKNRPELVLLDLRLPGMSGLDFLQLRPVQDSRVPIVVISGVATEHEAQMCLRLGALDFVPKPLPLEHLRAILEHFEPHVLTQTRELAGRAVERRRSPRVRVALPVQVRDYHGNEWETTSVDLSATSVKVVATGLAQPGPAVELSFTPPGEERLRVVSLLIRVDLDGYVFYFANLTDGQLERLTRLVRRLTVLSHSP
jgi:DNA-binding response OmpR family regulator